MKKLTSVLLCLGLLAITAVAGKPARPGLRHTIDRPITTDLLNRCGFQLSPKGTNTYIVKGVRVDDILRRLEIKATDLQRVGCLAEGEDVRYVAFSNGHFVFEANRGVVNGQPVAESLDKPESKCAVTVVFPSPNQEKTESQQQGGGYSPPAPGADQPTPRTLGVEGM